MEDSSPFTLKAPAKINWFLRVVGLRRDGFHEIRSLIQKVTLFDTLTFAASEDLTISGTSGIPPQDNIVYKTALILKDKYGIKDGAAIHIDKKIPMGAGLGGGSSDAAAALLGLNKLWSLHLSNAELCKSAKRIGSDVSFFLFSPISLVHGRGELITPKKALKPLHILLVKPSISISTAWAYKELSVSRKEAGSMPELTKKADKVNNIEHFIQSIERADISSIAGYSGAVSNDLESVTLKSFPVIAGIKEKLREKGSIFALMSGSGSTAFGVFESLEKAEEAAVFFTDHWRAVVQTITD
ncbi:MAG: 4-(cytidine 5'-diphospho)-2-C-methyl-D-erythritol kinase [Nitrospirae bacterium]|nr:4-(cytidine 5'-diphospho)-2-C-methyl-D-erythritol kinase [Nitrospirota bacterium]